MRVAVAVLTLAAACGGPRWHAVSPRPGAVYRYDAPIERYAPDDPGLWLVTARAPIPAVRSRLASTLADPDDVAGDGFVVWATDDRAAWLRGHPDVGAVVPLQPEARLAALPAGTTPIAVRIELAEQSADVQRAAVIAWLAARGVAARMVGPRTLDAVMPPAVARELVTLGPIRWVAPVTSMR